MGQPGFPIPLPGGGVRKPGCPTPLGPMFTSAIHAAPPRTDGMNILPGRAAPSQTLPQAGGWGKPGFPIPPRKGCALPNPPAGGVWGNQVPPCSRQSSMRLRRTTPDEHRLEARAARPRRVSAGKVTAPLPSPPPAGGRESGSSPSGGRLGGGVQRRMRVGEQPMFTLGVWGNPVSPHPCPRTPPAHGVRGRGNPVSPHPRLRAVPSQTLPRAGVWGNLVPPCSRQAPGLTPTPACSMIVLFIHYQEGVPWKLKRASTHTIRRATNGPQ